MEKGFKIPEGKEIDFEKSTIVLKQKIDEKEKLFLELFQGLQMKSDVEKFPNSVFYFRDGDLILEIEKDYLWVNYRNIWSIIGDRFDMSYNENQSFIKEMVEKHFKWKGLKPISTFFTFKRVVEKHFNSQISNSQISNSKIFIN